SLMPSILRSSRKTSRVRAGSTTISTKALIAMAGASPRPGCGGRAGRMPYCTIGGFQRDFTALCCHLDETVYHYSILSLKGASMPRALATILLAVVVAFATAACGGNGDGADDGRLRVVATVAPVGALAAEVGGEHIELRTLVGAGADPHSYEITSSDRRALADADVILRNGLGLDRFLDSALADDADKVVTVTEGVRLRVPGEDSHDHTEDD